MREGVEVEELHRDSRGEFFGRLEEANEQSRADEIVDQPLVRGGGRRGRGQESEGVMSGGDKVTLTLTLALTCDPHSSPHL